MYLQARASFGNDRLNEHVRRSNDGIRWHQYIFAICTHKSFAEPINRSHAIKHIRTLHRIHASPRQVPLIELNIYLIYKSISIIRTSTLPQPRAHWTSHPACPLAASLSSFSLTRWPPKNPPLSPFLLHLCSNIPSNYSKRLYSQDTCDPRERERVRSHDTAHWNIYYFQYQTKPRRPFAFDS